MYLEVMVAVVVSVILVSVIAAIIYVFIVAGLVFSVVVVVVLVITSTAMGSVVFVLFSWFFLVVVVVMASITLYFRGHKYPSGHYERDNASPHADLLTNSWKIAILPSPKETSFSLFNCFIEIR